MHKHTPHNPKKPSWFAHRVGDAQLCGGLDSLLNLTPSERRVVESGMARFVEFGALPRPLRDHLMAIARARGLFAATEIKAAPKKAKPLAVDGGDNFSTRPGKIEPRAAAQVPWLGGRMPAPIRRAG